MINFFVTSFVSSHEKPDTYLSNSAMSKFGASSMTKLPEQAGNQNTVRRRVSLFFFLILPK